MQRILSLAITGVLLALASAPASSQQLQQPTPLSPEPPKQGKGIGPQLNQSPVTLPPAIPSNPNQRPQSSSPIPSAGPAKQVPTELATPQFDPTKTSQPEKVPDATDKPVRGLIQMAPDRFYDPATGRYYKRAPPSGKPG